MPRRHATRPTIILAFAGLLMLGCEDDRDTQDGAVTGDAAQDVAVVEDDGQGDAEQGDAEQGETDGAIPGRGDDGEEGLGLDDPGEGDAGDDADDDAPEGEDDDGQTGAGQAGAGDDGEGEGGEVPTPGMTGFTEGEFDDIALPRGADEASEKTERDGVISQSFFAQQTSPEQIMDFFATSLDADGWTVVEPVSSRGTDSLAGAWTRDGRRLEVSALLAQGVENERTQFSVVLLPSLEPGEEVVGG